MIWETFPLLKFDFIGVFVNTWIADYNYPVRDSENLQFSLKCNYLKNKNFFWVFCAIYGIYIKF